MEEGLEDHKAARSKNNVRPKSTQYAMPDAEVGAVVESLLASRADAPPGIPLQDLPTDRVLAGDAHAVCPMFNAVQRGTQFVKLWIALERQQCINLVKIQAIADERLSR